MNYIHGFLRVHTHLRDWGAPEFMFIHSTFIEIMVRQ
jgi:hypothetical protein